MSQINSPQVIAGSKSRAARPVHSRLIPALLLSLLALAYSDRLLALATDRQQPIHISSDSAERDESKGITTYSGAVEMKQGSLQILAKKVVIHSTGNKISRITAIGTPAQYQQLPAADKLLVIARGDTIEYLINDNKLHLINNASLHQSDGTTMTGNRINYDIKAAIVTAEGGSSTSSDRIHMIIPPKPKDGAQSSEGTSPGDSDNPAANSNPPANNTPTDKP